MATTISSRDRLVSTNFCCDCETRPAAPREFSAFLRDMELISSLDAEVSSSEAACSEDPCASDWLEEETCEAALATCSAPSESSAITRVSAPLTLRTMTKVSRAPATTLKSSRPQLNRRVWFTDLVVASALSSPFFRFHSMSALTAGLSWACAGSAVAMYWAAASLDLPAWLSARTWVIPSI